MTYEQVKAVIDENITTNAQQEITGQKLNDVLNAIVDTTEEQVAAAIFRTLNTEV